MIHNGNVGVPLFRFGKLQCELWICRRGKIQSHRHDKFDSTLVFLGGRMLGTISGRTAAVGWKKMLHRYKIAAGEDHSSEVLSRFCAFINIEKWKPGTMTSAAVDFVTQ